jgi:hypothetical protein
MAAESRAARRQATATSADAAERSARVAREENLARQLSVEQRARVETATALQVTTEERDKARRVALKLRAALNARPISTQPATPQSRSHREAAARSVKEGTAQLRQAEQREQRQQQRQALEEERDYYRQDGEEAREELERTAQEQRQVIAALTAERDDARRDARQAEADLKAGQQQIAAQAVILEKAVDEFRAQQEALSIQVREHDFAYNPIEDRLVLAMLPAQAQSHELAYWQSMRSERVTGRWLIENRPLLRQATDLAMAARWSLRARPPKAYRKEVRWQREGYLLDADSERYLIEQTATREGEQWVKTFWLNPWPALLARRRRRKRV